MAINLFLHFNTIEFNLNGNNCNFHLSITNIPDKGYSPHTKIPQINISSAGVSKLLSNINLHKACGPDNIHGRVLRIKELNEQVAPILTSIFSKSLKSGEISKDWKHANVAPAFKKGEK